MQSDKSITTQDHSEKKKIYYCYQFTLRQDLHQAVNSINFNAHENTNGPSVSLLRQQLTIW